MATKTIMKVLRGAGLVNPRKVKVGTWKKVHFAHWGWRKIRALSGRLKQIGLCFSAWVNYMRSGGEFSLESVLAAEKPP